MYLVYIGEYVILLFNQADMFGLESSLGSEIIRDLAMKE